MPEARTLPCPIRAACGGCAWMARDEAAQRAEKATRIERAVGQPPDAVVPSPLAVGYRARIRVAFDRSGRAGYHRPRSHEVVPIPRCAIARPEVNRALEQLHALLPDGRGLRDVELRSDGTRVVYAARSSGRRAAAGLERLGDVALDGRTVAGDPRLSLRVAGIEHRLGPSSFYQVNLEGNALLVAAVLDEVLALAPEAVLDLYAGAGNLSLPLAARGIPVTLLERAGGALKDARETVERHRLGARVIASPAERYRAGDLAFDVAILDPPRAGAQGVMTRLLTTRPRGIVYVSCNPDTLGRDLRAARGAGYRLTRLTGFDFFPQTPHVETLAVLRR